MNLLVAMPSPAPDLLARLEPGLARLERQAEMLDREARFPVEAVGLLRETGALLAPLPSAFAGAGLGASAGSARALTAVLRRIGRASLSLGRVYEGHVNGVRLVVRYGTPAQTRRMAEDVAAGHLTAIWAAEDPRAPVTLRDGMLHGRKSFASGVGVVTRPVVTARHLDDEQLVVADVASRQAAEVFDLHGIRSAATAAIRLDGITIAAEQMIGGPGDYMRQPEISLGAWRPLAVILGGLDGVVDALRADLLGRGRDGDPHQRARFGRVVLSRDTAALWVAHAAVLAEDVGDEVAAAQVKLARIAVEDTVVEALRLAQRCVGMPGFVRPHPIERLARDLSTYLRQPALDMVLDEAAGFYLGDEAA